MISGFAPKTAAFLMVVIFLLSGLAREGHAQSSDSVPAPPVKPDIRNDDGGGFIGRINRIFSSGDTPQAQDNDSPPLPDAKPKIESKTYTIDIDALQKRPMSRVISSKDAQLYRQIFSAQKAGHFNQANRFLQQISNPLLLGHVLYQRYMHPDDYTSEYEELKNWMAHYSDHPGADKLYALAQRKGGARGLKKPKRFSGLGRLAEPTMRAARPYVSKRKRSAAQKAEIRRIENSIFGHLRRGQTDQALSQLQHGELSKLMDTAEIDVLSSEIAASLLYSGNVTQAFNLASAAAQRSGAKAPKASWVAGLISWKNERYSPAARYFEVAAQSPHASGWLITAASYWSARAHMRAGSIKKVSFWLSKGMKYPRTFYGLISTRALGLDFDFNWDMPTFTKKYHNTLSSIPAGARAIALAKAGQPAKAQAELLRIKPKNLSERAAFLAFSEYADLPALSMRIASAFKASKQSYYDAALYPHIPWKPHGGFQVDQALLHAIMKQESRFNPLAVSHSGARGLMQLMPATARGVNSAKADRLEEPEINLELGQRYVKELLKSKHVDNNLLYLLIAYNAGPGNLRKWRERWPDVQDPLLFIELLPSAETRGYIERVLANYWIYRMRDGKDIASMEAIAAGRTAMYTSE